MSVDLPMPGDPPINTSDPGTKPPPSTRSSSPMPVRRRSTFAARTSRSATGVSARPPPPEPEPERPLAARTGAAARASSAIEFHSPQPGQRPCHFGLS